MKTQIQKNSDPKPNLNTTEILQIAQINIKKFKEQLVDPATPGDKPVNLGNFVPDWFITR